MMRYHPVFTWFFVIHFKKKFSRNRPINFWVLFHCLLTYLCRPIQQGTRMREVQYRQAVAEAMSEEMRRDSSVFLMGEEVAEYNGAYKASKGMLEEFGPERVIDTPIAELGFSGIAVGAAMNGLRPIVEFMTWNFAVLAADQIINHAAKMLQMSGGQYHVPIVFRGPNGTAGQLGATHSQSFESMYASIPGLKVVTPFTPYEAKGLLKSAIRDNDPRFGDGKRKNVRRQRPHSRR